MGLIVQHKILPRLFSIPSNPFEIALKSRMTSRTPRLFLVHHHSLFSTSRSSFSFFELLSTVPGVLKYKLGLWPSGTW